MMSFPLAYSYNQHHRCCPYRPKPPPRPRRRSSPHRYSAAEWVRELKIRADNLKKVKSMKSAWPTSPCHPPSIHANRRNHHLPMEWIYRKTEFLNSKQSYTHHKATRDSFDYDKDIKQGKCFYGLAKREGGERKVCVCVSIYYTTISTTQHWLAIVRPFSQPTSQPNNNSMP